jgi:hypothetical protein
MICLRQKWKFKQLKRAQFFFPDSWGNMISIIYEELYSPAGCNYVQAVTSITRCSCAEPPFLFSVWFCLMLLSLAGQFCAARQQRLLLLADRLSDCSPMCQLPVLRWSSSTRCRPPKLTGHALLLLIKHLSSPPAGALPCASSTRAPSSVSRRARSCY